MIFVAANRTTARQVGLALQRQTLDQQAGRNLVVGREHQAGVELFTLQHVVFDHLAELFQFFSPVAKQRHHPLVRLAAGQAVLGIECDGATSFVVDVDHVRQRCIGSHLAHHRGSGTKAQVGLHFGHGQFHRPIAHDLHDQRTFELDVGLHQGGRRRHFAQQFGHGCGIAPGLLAPAQNVLPGIGQAHEHAAHRQAFKHEFVEFGQNGLSENQARSTEGQPIFFKPVR